MSGGGGLVLLLSVQFSYVALHAPLYVEADEGGRMSIFGLTVVYPRNTD